MKDLSSCEQAQSPELPHDVLSDAVGQRGIPLRVARQREHILKHLLHVISVENSIF